MIQSIQERSQGEVRCPYCRDQLALLPAQHCSGCGVGYHRTCTAELAQCATVGCSTSLAPKPEVLFRTRETPEIRLRPYLPHLMAFLGLVSSFAIPIVILMSLSQSQIDRHATLLALSPIVLAAVASGLWLHCFRKPSDSDELL